VKRYRFTVREAIIAGDFWAVSAGRDVAERSQSSGVTTRLIGHLSSAQYAGHQQAPDRPALR
jgi:hypothetical protein